MYRVTGSAAEDRMIAVLALARRALGSAFEPARDARITVVPAARALQQVAADRSEVPNLRARRHGGRLRERAVAGVDHLVRLDLRERRERADLEPFGPRFDAARQERLHVQQPLRRGDLG